MFAFVVLLIAPLFFTGPVLAEMTMAQVIANIQTVTTMSSNLNTVASSVTVTISFEQVSTSATQIGTDFEAIITALYSFITPMSGTVFDDADAQQIVVVLDSFVQIHQALLATVIGKQGIFAQFVLTAPIAAVLRSLEAVIDSFAFALIAMIPTQAPAVQKGQGMLDVTCTTAINTYEEFCIPSILYPNLMPICVAL